MSALLGSYTNGNYKVSIYSDGTKIKETEDDAFKAAFPESMDVKITNYCDIGCPYCHEDSTVKGKHGAILNLPFVNSLRPYTEMALGGGNPLSHPDLIPFLEILKERKVIANMTVNQRHFLNNTLLLKELTKKKLIYGLGVSFQCYSDSLIKALGFFPNAVLHAINGIVELDDLELMYNQNCKLLILGYKQFRRGLEFYYEDVERRKQKLYANLPEVLQSFKVVSFDNRALEQLEVKRLLSDDEWNSFYQGDDGSHTMYVDLVEQKFALNSTSHVTYDLLDTVDAMFKTVQSL